MAVGAFKTKYTGEQMEALFDKLSTSSDDNNIPTIGEGQYYTTEIPMTNTITSGWLYGQTVETNFGTLILNGTTIDKTNLNIATLLSTNSLLKIALNNNATLTYEFKKPVTLLRYRCNAKSNKITLYYWINNEWVSQGNINSGTTELTSQTTEKVKVEFAGTSNGYITYSIFDFMSDSYIISGPTIKDITTTEG